MIRTKHFATLLMIAIGLSPCRTENALAADGSDKLVRVRMGLAARSTTSMPFFVAKERGFFREEGLDQPSFDLIVQPNITSVQQLRGKKIGTGGVGSLAEILARRILIAHNVRPEDVTILATGPSHMTYLSLKAKVIDAAPLQMPLTFTAQDEGFRKLVSAADVYRAVQGGLATTKAMLTEQPELVTKVVRAMLKAIRLIKSDRKFSIDFIKGPWLDIGKEPEKIAARVHDIAGPALLENGWVSEDIQRQMIADAAVRIKPKQPVLPEQVFDFSIVRKVGETLR
jgi:ABC-type nitrate/sulfonate/bicarbonate transport system substrate-binding protein